MNPTLGLHELLTIVRRRKLLVVLIALLGVVLSTLALAAVEPTYRAETVLMVDPRDQQVIDIESVTERPTQGLMDEMVRSEVDVLTNHDLARAVIEELGLLETPGFREDPDEAEPLDNVLGWITTAFAGDAEGISSPDAAGARDEAVESATGRYLDGLSARSSLNSYVIRLAFEWTDPELAARIVNAHAQLYLDRQLQAKLDANAAAYEWLGRQVDEQQARLRDAERAVQAYHERNQMVEAVGEAVLDRQLVEMNANLSEAQGDLSVKEARLRELDGLLEVESPDVIADAVNSPLIQRLRGEEARMRSQEANLAESLGPRHPQRIAARAEVADLQREIEAELGRIANSLASEAGIARSRVESLQAAVDDLQRRSLDMQGKGVQLRELERDVTVSRELFESFLHRYEQLAARAELERPDARLVSLASVPSSPAFPPTKAFLALSGLLSVAGGVGVAVALERLRNAIRSPAELERATGLACLGSTPVLKRRFGGWRRTAIMPHDETALRPTGRHAEAVRGIRDSLLASKDEPWRGVLLVTSVLPDEGKSTLAISLARSAASGKRRVLLIDCDLRRRSASERLLRAEPKHGLAEALEHPKTLKWVVQKDARSTMHFCAGSRRDGDAYDLLDSERMQRLLQGCRKFYDLIVLDSPPVAAVADSLVLARLADRTALVVRWRSTPISLIKTAINKLRQAGATLAGGVITFVDLDRNFEFDEGDFEFHYHKNKKYYLDRESA